MIKNIETKNMEIGTIVNRFIDDEYVANPLYQSDDTRWKVNKKQAFIMSILTTPIPVPIFLDDREDNPVVYILDGQQRLTALKGFINNDYRLPRARTKNDVIYAEIGGESYHVSGKYFGELRPTVQKYFERHQIPVTTFKDGTDEDMALTYARINSGTPLNNAEHRKAMNPVLTQVIEEIINTNKLFTKSEAPLYVKSPKAREGWRSIIEKTLLAFTKGIDYGISAETLKKQAEEQVSISMTDDVVADMMESFTFVANSLQPFTEWSNPLVRGRLVEGKFTSGLLGKNMVKLATYLHHDLSRKHDFDFSGREAVFGDEILLAVTESRVAQNEFYGWSRDDSAKSQEQAFLFLKRRVLARLTSTEELERTVDEYLGGVAEA